MSDKNAIRFDQVFKVIGTSLIALLTWQGGKLVDRIEEMGRQIHELEISQASLQDLYRRIDRLEDQVEALRNRQ